MIFTKKNFLWSANEKSIEFNLNAFIYLFYFTIKMFYSEKIILQVNITAFSATQF